LRGAQLGEPNHVSLKRVTRSAKGKLLHNT
jgi:hypothetical protein